ncbi:hypothetical protein [Streptomyces macrosporus]|uniref:Uncharacterized protein n=1 Tax=Streptomyces macrosporus TaxID=44032 RepID=A0ABN3K8J8_9ACTN
MTSLFLTLGALVTASTLAAPAAGAAPRADRPAAVPAGWERIDGAEPAAMTDAADGKRSLATADTTTGDAADETPVLAVQSVRNGNFVATEKNHPSPHTGALRARSADVGGSWEEFVLYDLGV